VPANCIRAVLLALGVVCAAALAGCAKTEIPETSPQPAETTLLAAGDVLLGRRLGKMMHDSGDFALGFKKIAPELAAADLAFANLEGPFCESGPYPGEGMRFRVRPQAIEGLKAAGIDVMSVANNHIADGGAPCVRFTLDHLREAGIAAAGAGKTYEDAHRAEVIERNGVRFAFLGYTYAAQYDIPPPVGDVTGTEKTLKSDARRRDGVRSAVRKVPGYVVAGRNEENLRRDVAAARARADVVIVSLHDGVEYAQRVAPETESFARAAIDAGAVAVLGHHPHVPQRVEEYGGGWIFYSLGNFVFQQNTPSATKTALMARLTFAGKELRRVEAVPIVIDWYSQPRLADDPEGARILQSVGISARVLWEKK